MKPTRKRGGGNSSSSNSGGRMMFTGMIYDYVLPFCSGVELVDLEGQHTPDIGISLFVLTTQNRRATTSTYRSCSPLDFHFPNHPGDHPIAPSGGRRHRTLLRPLPFESSFPALSARSANRDSLGYLQDSLATTARFVVGERSQCSSRDLLSGDCHNCPSTRTLAW